MDIIGPPLEGAPIDDEERLQLFMEFHPESLVSRYITWLEDELRSIKEQAESEHRELVYLRRNFN